MPPQIFFGNLPEFKDMNYITITLYIEIIPAIYYQYHNEREEKDTLRI